MLSPPVPLPARGPERRRGVGARSGMAPEGSGSTTRRRWALLEAAVRYGRQHDYSPRVKSPPCARKAGVQGQREFVSEAGTTGDGGRQQPSGRPHGDASYKAAQTANAAVRGHRRCADGLAWHMNWGMTRWKVDPLKCRGLPERPVPFSPVHRQRKFSAVLGATSARSSITMRPSGVLPAAGEPGGRRRQGQRSASGPPLRRRTRSDCGLCGGAESVCVALHPCRAVVPLGLGLAADHHRQGAPVKFSSGARRGQANPPAAICIQGGSTLRRSIGVRTGCKQA